ncbi:MAG TPA: hypothetical protein VNP04_15615 [Alphaproteobacteria bacterium]|nr:hypothetical protein [Alphaproteobacteria bacterium]
MKAKVFLRTLPRLASGCPVPILWRLKAEPPPGVYHAVVGHRALHYDPDAPPGTPIIREPGQRRIQIVLYPATHGNTPCDCPPLDPAASNQWDYHKALAWFTAACQAMTPTAIDEAAVVPKLDYMEDPLLYCPPARIYLPHWRNLDLSPDDPEARKRGYELARQWAQQDREARLKLLDMRQTTPVQVRYVGDRFRHVSIGGQ